jgi:hypothetical protein
MGSSVKRIISWGLNNSFLQYSKKIIDAGNNIYTGLFLANKTGEETDTGEDIPFRCRNYSAMSI